MWIKKEKKKHWKELQPPYQVGINEFTLKDLKKSWDGWIDAEIYHPFAYELVRLHMEHKTVNGWWNGLEWEGLRLRDGDVVLSWKMDDEVRER